MRYAKLDRKQAETARAFDQAITDQIHEIQPSIPQGSEVFVTMTFPLNIRNGFGEMWPRVTYMEMLYAPLWYKYRRGVNQITYTNAARSPQGSARSRVSSPGRAICEHRSTSCLSFRGQRRSFRYGDKKRRDCRQERRACRLVYFPLHGKREKADRLISARIAKQ